MSKHKPRPICDDDGNPTPPPLELDPKSFERFGSWISRAFSAGTITAHEASVYTALLAEQRKLWKEVMQDDISDLVELHDEIVRARDELKGLVASSEKRTGLAKAPGRDNFEASPYGHFHDEEPPRWISGGPLCTDKCPTSPRHLSPYKTKYD